MTSGDVTSEIAVDDWERDCLATLLCCDPGRALVSNKCMTNGEHPRILSFQSSVFTNEFQNFFSISFSISFDHSKEEATFAS